MGANRSSQKISDHLGCIYDLLNNLQTQISNEVSARQTGVQQAKDAAAAAKTAANTAQSTADSKVDTKTYNNHLHKFNVLRRKVSINGKESAEEFVYSLSSGSGFSTSRPI